MEATQTQDSTRFTTEYNNLISKFRDKIKVSIKENGIRVAKLEQELFETGRVNAKNGLLNVDTLKCYNDVIYEHHLKIKNKDSKKRGL
jgi:hypothetical protein